MKKILTAILVILTLSACTGVPRVILDELPNNEKWNKGHFVDNFGDETGETYFIQSSVGSFSNTATSGSLLYADFLLTGEYFRIDLYEYSRSYPSVKFSEYATDTEKHYRTLTMKNEKGMMITINNFEPNHRYKNGYYYNTYGQVIEFFNYSKTVKVRIVGDYEDRYNFTLDVRGISSKRETTEQN